MDLSSLLFFYQAGANAPGFKMRFMKWCVVSDTGRFFGRFKISN